jgi:hypothetical protein
MAVPIGLTISALVVAIFALVLYVLQMIWGRPKIVLDFDVSEFEGARLLECEIHNEPIARGLLRMLRIRRMVAEDIMAYFSIKEQGSNRVVFSGDVPHIYAYTGVKSQRISLAASPFPAIFGIVEVDYGSGVVKVFDEKLKFDEEVTLERGAYYTDIKVAADGEHIRAKRNFEVSDKHPFAYWI